MFCKKNILFIVALALSALLFFISLLKRERAVHDNRPLVVCTTGIIADVVRAIAGSDIRVQALMGPGIDPHLYRARPGDVQKLADAAIIFYNGLHLEGKMADILSAMSLHKKTIAIADAIPTALVHESNSAGVYDPHVWHAVALWALVVPVIAHELTILDPVHAMQYNARAQEYAKELRALDDYVHSAVERIAPAQRILVTAHDAFGYFGQAYGFEVIGLQGISTDSEVSIADVQNLVDTIIERKVPAIFVETSIAQRALHAVQQACAARGWHVELGDALFSDALGNPGTPEGTYVGMIRHNIDAITSALANSSVH